MPSCHSDASRRPWPIHVAHSNPPRAAHQRKSVEQHVALLVIYEHVDSSGRSWLFCIPYGEAGDECVHDLCRKFLAETVEVALSLMLELETGSQAAAALYQGY